MDRRQTSQVTTGSIVILIGLTLLAGQLNLGWAWNIGRLWPVVLLVLGVGRWISSSEEGRGSGAWLIFLGLLFLMHTNRILSLQDSWPLFIVAGGVSIMFSRDRGRRRRGADAAPGPASSTLPGDRFGDGRFHP